jgi:hypothetical protein
MDDENSTGTGQRIERQHIYGKIFIWCSPPPLHKMKNKNKEDRYEYKGQKCSLSLRQRQEIQKMLYGENVRET